MSSDMKYSTANAAEVSADMEHHRSTYGMFFNLLKYSVFGFAIVLAILFFTLN